MTFKEWVSKHLGKYVKYNKSTSGYQCVDEIKSALVEISYYNFYGKYPYLKNYWSFGNARDWYEDYYNYKELTENFKRLQNTPSFVPIEYDICIFTEGNKYGHICMAYNNDSTTNKIYTIDQNYPTGSKVKYCVHRYTSEGFLGVLRPYRTIKDDVNIRSKPSTSGNIIGELKKGQKISIENLDASKKWAKVKEGWISYSYVNKI